jgi:hypothetical protein
MDKGIRIMKILLVMSVFALVGCVSRSTMQTLPPGVERHVRENGRVDYVIRNIENSRTNVTKKAITFLDMRIFEDSLSSAMPSEAAYRYDFLDSSVVLYGADVDLARKTYDRLRRSFLLRSDFWDELLLQEKKSPDFAPRLFEKAHTNTILDGVVGTGSSVFSLSHTPNNHTIFTVHSNSYTNHMAQDFELVYTNRTFSLRKMGIERRASSDKSESYPNKVSIRYESGKLGTVLISPASPGCTDHLAYVLRIFDESGRYIWQAPKHIIASPHILRATDLDGDGIDEIILCLDDHMRASMLIFRKVRVQE